MAREIKFRGIKVQSGKWAYGDIYQNPQEKKVYMSGDSSETMGGISHTLWDVKPETVGQYTGLTDKNGKDVYEGDIVKEPGGDLRIIEYIGSAFHSHSIKNSWTHPLFLAWVSNGKTDQMKLEVVGNIYEHPELLTK